MGTPAKKTDDDKPDETQDQTTKPIVVTVGGHEYTIEAEARDDFELLDLLYESQQSGTSVRMPAIMRRLLGEEQAKVALDRLRNTDTGRVTVDDGHKFVNDLLEALNPN